VLNDVILSLLLVTVLKKQKTALQINRDVRLIMSAVDYVYWYEVKKAGTVQTIDLAYNLFPTKIKDFSLDYEKG
jgi:hypothetical protein